MPVLAGRRPGVSAASHRFIRIRLPLRSDHVAAHGTESVRDVILVEHRDGTGRHQGWGECPTLSTAGYVGGTTEQAWASIGLWAAGRIDAGDLPTMVRAARRDAALDARLLAEGRSLSDHLGGTLRAVPTCRVVAVAPADRSAAIAAALDDAASGRDAAAMIKVKVSGADLAALAEVRSQIGPEVALAADANGTIGVLTDSLGVALVAIGLTYLEQPAPPEPRSSAIAESWDSAPVPIALDESITSLGELDAALARGPYVMSIKPARLGGIAEAAAGVAHARAAGGRWFVGGLLETGIGRAAALAVASIGGPEMLPTDLGPSSRYVEQDICEPHCLDADGHLRVPVGPGIGRRPDPDRLAGLTIDEIAVAL